MEGHQLPPNQAIPLVEQEGSHLYLGTSQMQASVNSLVDSEINQQALQDLECKHLWSEGSELPHLLSGDLEEPRQVWQEDLVPRRQWQEVLDNQLQMLDLLTWEVLDRPLKQEALASQWEVLGVQE